MVRRLIIIFLLIILTKVIAMPSRYEAVIAGNAAGGSQTVPGEPDLRTPEGEKVSLIPFIGRKAVVVVFWATWCPLCRAEVPHLNRLNSDRRVAVIAVNEGESIKKIQTFVTLNSVGYDVVLDPNGGVAKSFGVPGMPFCVIIGKSGQIAYRGSGLPEDIDHFLNQ